MPNRPILSAHLLCMASMLVWAVALPAAEVLIDRVPPIALIAARMAMAALVLVPLWLALEGPGPIARAHWGRGLLVGATGIGLGAVLMIMGQAQTGPVTVAVISATMPVWGMALEVVFDRRPVTLALVLGLVLSLLGGGAALFGPSEGGAGDNLVLGAGFCFLSALAFTWGSRLTVTAFPDLSAIGRTTVTVTGAAGGASIAALIAAPLGQPLPALSGFGWGDLGALVLFAVFGMAISQALWIGSVQRLGIGLASFHINTAPFYVMAIMWGLGAPWIWAQMAGAVLVAFGVIIASRSPLEARHG